MRTDAWLQAATGKLKTAAIDSARLDCLILLEDISGRDRAWLLAHPEHMLETTMLSTLDRQIERRASHEPLAYIRGTSEFYGRNFMVDRRVLTPRPESEVIIELLLRLVLTAMPELPLSVERQSNATSLSIVDVGTGSGALAISAKLEIPTATVYATDIDADCLAVATANATSLQAEINVLQTDLLEGLLDKARTDSAPDGRVDIVLANLPYVPDNYGINRAATNEPAKAIFGGADGLDLYRRMMEQIQGASSRPNYILTESLPVQHDSLSAIMLTAGYVQTEQHDFVQVFRRQA